MDYIFTPWRYAYVSSLQRATACIFCDRAQAAADKGEEDLVVYRGPLCFIVVNRYPYTSGHVMVVPYQHIDRLELLPAEAATEMMVLTQRMEGVLRRLYSPDGLNLGMNLGRAAGAGVAGHIHMHVLPRWMGDSSFMSVVGETRVLPESLEETARRIRDELAK